MEHRLELVWAKKYKGDIIVEGDTEEELMNNLTSLVEAVDSGALPPHLAIRGKPLLVGIGVLGAYGVMEARAAVAGAKPKEAAGMAAEMDDESKESWSLRGVFEREIAPIMDKLYELCDKHRIPIFTAIQYAQEGGRSDVAIMSGRRRDGDHCPLFDQLDMVAKFYRWMSGQS